MDRTSSLPRGAPETPATDRPAETDPTRRRLLIATSVAGAAGMVATAVPFVASLTPSARARAEGGPVEADLSRLAPGELKIVEWRKQPVWLLRRSPEMLASLSRDEGLLADPGSHSSLQPPDCVNRYRSIKPEFAVMIGICTHLGCSPTLKPAGPDSGMGPDWPGGFLCPCHGSKFDLAGRVFRGVPAPTNLVIPTYRFISTQSVRIGEGSA